MLKRLFIIAFSIVSLIPCWGVKTKIDIKTTSKDKVNHPILRSPISFPIEAVYDDEAMTLEIFCVNDVEAEVYVYNASDEVEGYSPCLNTIIPLSPSPYHTIVIEGSDWTATGRFE